MTILLWLALAVLLGPGAASALALPEGGDFQPWTASVGGPSSRATPAADGYAHPEWLAEPDWLKERLGDPTVRVVALTPADEFAADHIPGAAQIDWPDLEVVDTADPSIARWQGEVERRLTGLGIAPASTVVVYDGGTLYAPRLWWVLHQLGHADKRVLNGGLAAWREAGGEVETGAPRTAAAASPYEGTPQPDVLAQLPEVEAALGDPGVVLVDARTAEEYAAGHIPGAVLVPFTDNAVPDEPRRWKSAAELRALYAAHGVTPDKRVVPYCTTGVRSANTYFTLGLLGFEELALYTGSWKEWSAHPELPKTTGPEP